MQPDDMAAWSQRLGDWSEAESRLRIATYTDEWLATKPHALLLAQVYDGLHTVLALDLPNTVALVNEPLLEVWGKSRKAVEAVALMNTMAEPINPQTNEVQGVPLLGVFAPHLYAGLHAQVPERHLPDLGPAGALVGVPAADAVVLHRVGDAEVGKALMIFGGVVAQIFGNAPSPRTRAIYWYRPGQPAKYVGNGGAEVINGVRVTATLNDEVVKELESATRA